MFRRFISLCVVTVMITMFHVANAQLQLPRPSPGAEITQTAGLTDITISYSSPGVKGREIFGGLVAYDKLWRTGANASTKITFSKDVSINDNEVPAGTYSVFTIPGTESWTIILNKNKGASAGSYKQEEDQLRISVKPGACELRERMAFIFSDFDEDKCNVNLEWEKTRVTFTIHVGTDQQARKNIDSHLGRTWRDYNGAARYYLSQKKELDKGLKHVDQSITLDENWFNVWTKAEMYNAMENSTEAYRFALKAKELGNEAENFFWKDRVEKAIEDWAPKAGKKGAK